MHGLRHRALDGINAAATETICFGDTSMNSTRSGVEKVNSFLCLTGTNVSVNFLSRQLSHLPER